MAKFSDAKKVARAFDKAGMTFHWRQKVDNGHHDVLWYGGLLATVDAVIQGRTVQAEFYAAGDSSGCLYDDNGEVLADWSDHQLSGDRGGLTQYVEDDVDLSYERSKGNLDIKEHNWVQMLVYTDDEDTAIHPDGDTCDTNDVIEAIGTPETFEERVMHLLDGKGAG